MDTEVDAEGSYAEGLSLLSGSPGPDEVKRAVALLRTSAEAGHGAAAERCALVEAMGIVAPSNWDRALDYLRQAAELGHEAAQAQLLLLSGHDWSPGRNPDPSISWGEVRREIRIADRIAAGERIVLSEEPRVRAIRGFASPAECRWLIDIAKRGLEPATVFDDATGQQRHHSARDNSFFVLQLTIMDVVSEVIRNRIATATRLPVPLFEPTQVLHYAVGQRFEPHHDFLDPANPAYVENLAKFGQRIATFLVYLNEEFEGGESSFPAAGLQHRGTTGDALFFANVNRAGDPDPSTLHAGLPPTSGEKWILSQWIRDRTPPR